MIACIRLERGPIADTIGVSELALRLAEELYAVVQGVDDCQLAAEDILDRHLTGDDMVRLQALDPLSQAIAEIAGVLERLAAEPGLGLASAGLFDPIRLGDLKRRLQGVETPAAETGGEPELW